MFHLKKCAKKRHKQKCLHRKKHDPRQFYRADPKGASLLLILFSKPEITNMINFLLSLQSVDMIPPLMPFVKGNGRKDGNFIRPIVFSCHFSGKV